MGGGVTQENTLHDAEDFHGKAKELFTLDGRFRQFDIIFTNPPFGTKTKVVRQDAAHFQLGHVWKEQNGHWVKTDKTRATEPQVLFIERCLEMLVDGGTLAIVLPETIFHAPHSRHILDFMLRGNNLKAIIDLPHNTFRPHNNAKTCLTVLQKGRPQQSDIVMAVAEEMGHDHEGRLLYRYDAATQRTTDIVWDDLAIIRGELSNPFSEVNQYTFVVNTSDIKEGIYVPRYYWPKPKKERAKAAAGIMPVALGDLVDQGILTDYSGHGSPPSEYKGKGEIPYIRVADIVNWELYRNPTAYVPRHVYLKLKGRNGITLQPGDVVFVRRGSYRIGTVAMASPQDKEVLLTREFVVLRVAKPNNDYGITPYYLMYLLSHKFTQSQMPQNVFIDTTLPNIADRWRDLLLPIHISPDERRGVSERIRKIVGARWGALEQLDALRQEFGGITT